MDWLVMEGFNECDLLNEIKGGIGCLHWVFYLRSEVYLDLECVK